MKKLISLIAAAAAAILLAGSLSAQDQYLTNGAGDNWFIGIGAGINTTYDNGTYLFKPGVAVEADFGKWFTPSVGFRAGYHGISAFAADPKGWFTGSDMFGYHFAHIDGLWNISNTLGGYKETRFWDFIPYLQGGLVVGTGNNKMRTNIGLGAGVINDLRLSEHVDLALEIGAVVVPEQMFRESGGRFTFFPSATLGLVFNLGKTGFEKYYPCPLVDLPDYTGVINDLKGKLADATAQLDAAKKEITSLKERLAHYQLVDGKTYDYKGGEFFETVPKEAQPEIFYFDVAKTVLSERELARLEFYAKNTFKKDQKLLISGGADAGTGSAALNDRLSKQRAEYVKNLLVKTYGFNPDSLETEAEVLKSDSPIKGRIVTIRVK